MDKPPIERIDVFDCSTSPAERLCSFWWAEGRGVSCDQKFVIDRLAIQGIATPPDGELVFPCDGRRFFDSLQDHFCGSYLRANATVFLQQGTGEELPTCSGEGFA